MQKRFSAWIPNVQKFVLDSNQNVQKRVISCRSRQELSNEYLLANFGVDAAENGPLEVCLKFAKLEKSQLEKK